ncbi:hypothetical protein [Flagellimonas nanhaiensis]|uniref:hypothetical protein n=1 Tax=Flagellimonas nanhaiensis TaxID=2292706 RepID=UPI0015F252BA|nr:hypothetical protein [Allomuricauda nanhaiensis]
MGAFNVNMDAAIALTAKLERINRSAFPVAVRQTLNDAAFTTKKMVPKVAAQKFTTRQKNFFKAFTIVNKAEGYNVNRMVAETGINSNKPRGTKVAVGLEQQEKGGTVMGRKFVPHNKARVSGSFHKKVSKLNLLTSLKYGTPKSRIKGSNIILIKKGSKGTLFRVRNLKTKTKLTPLYTYRRTKKSRVDSRPFVSPSATFARSKMLEYYKKNAEFQFKRALK